MTRKEKEIINTNKAVVVNFPAHINAHQTTQSGSATIYIPFPVKQIMEHIPLLTIYLILHHFFR